MGISRALISDLLELLETARSSRHFLHLNKEKLIPESKLGLPTQMIEGEEIEETQTVTQLLRRLENCQYKGDRVRQYLQKQWKKSYAKKIRE